MKSNAIYGFHILVGGLFVAAGGAKVAGVDIMVQEFDLVGLGQSFRILVGFLEIIGGLCLVVRAQACSEPLWLPVRWRDS
jgi:uncharacterized membrane protein YphA (DoxX/SURF4 family)